jgi:hypothetical protein
LPLGRRATCRGGVGLFEWGSFAGGNKFPFFLSAVQTFAFIYIAVEIGNSTNQSPLVAEYPAKEPHRSVWEGIMPWSLPGGGRSDGPSVVTLHTRQLLLHAHSHAGSHSDHERHFGAGSAHPTIRNAMPIMGRSFFIGRWWILGCSSVPY